MGDILQESQDLPIPASQPRCFSLLASYGISLDTTAQKGSLLTIKVWQSEQSFTHFDKHFISVSFVSEKYNHLVTICTYVSTYLPTSRAK